MKENNTKNTTNKFILLFFLLVIGIGGLGYGPWVLASYGLFPEDFVMPFFLLGGLSPTIAAIITIILQRGTEGINALFKQFTQKNFSPIWFVIPFLTSIIICLTAYVAFEFYSGASQVSLIPFVSYLPLLLFYLFQNVWEEIGWRGFALPTLQQKYSALYSSFIVGIFWAIWHWPHFVVKDSEMASSYYNFFFFVISVLVGSIIYTWLYNSSNGSFTIVTLYHASYNAIATTFFVFQEINEFMFPYLLTTNVIVAAVIVFITKPKNLSHNPRVTFNSTLESS